jgi:hypothetical protein
LDDVYIDSWTYAVGASTPTAATPTFSLPAGTYTSEQTVAMKDATDGATIYFTLDGTTPTTSSIQYYSPTTVSASKTVKAMAVASGYTNSSMASAAYTINLAPTAPPFANTAAGRGTAELFPVDLPSLADGDAAYVGFTGGAGGPPQR